MLRCRQIFVDGALRRNNPIREANKESRDIWPGEERLIVSIGTGRYVLMTARMRAPLILCSAPGGNVAGGLLSLAQRLKDIVVDSEQTARDFAAENDAMIRSNRLFRFNVYHGLADVGLEEYKAVNVIAASTSSYLSEPEVTMKINDCVETLRDGGQRLGVAYTVEGSLQPPAYNP